jgi:hypothetical protein
MGVISKYEEISKHFSVQQILYLVEEVNKTGEISSSNSSLNKKTQASLKAMLKNLFPENGNFLWLPW